MVIKEHKTLYVTVDVGNKESYCEYRYSCLDTIDDFFNNFPKVPRVERKNPHNSVENLLFKLYDREVPLLEMFLCELCMDYLMYKGHFKKMIVEDRQEFEEIFVNVKIESE